MDMQFQIAFVSQWRKYFGEAELPLTIEYANEDRDIPAHIPGAEPHCIIGVLEKARAGSPVRMTRTSFGSAGGRFYCGFTPTIPSGVGEYFSHDDQGKGQRYKKTPEIAWSAYDLDTPVPAPAANLIFKRWDLLSDADHPSVVIFFATPDVLSGLFTLANYAESRPEGVVMAPFATGCAAIVKYPGLEAKKEHPRAVLGMFDITARPFVPAGTLSLAIPIRKFEEMVSDMDESFLTTNSWQKVRARMDSEARL
jgi:hypothetical protein